MQESKISWTMVTWNPISGCSKVSDGCKFCYAMELSLRRGWTTKPWTKQNEEENVVMKPHKLHEPYKLKEPSRVFTNSMSDMFHDVLPDWYVAAMFCVMLDLPQHTFQVLTKRPERTVDWHEKFVAALADPAFIQFREEVKDKRVKDALSKQWDTPWGDNIWMGTSVEDARVLHRIDSLRSSKAVTRFISAEPLLGPFGPNVNFADIHWVIVGGESGSHMTPDSDRWMKQEWAREIKDQCVAQGVAFFYKQDSGVRTELRPFLVETDGTRWEWHQYPGHLTPPVALDKRYRGYEDVTIDPDWGNAGILPVAATSDSEPEPPAPPPTPARVVRFHDVKDKWDATAKRWLDPTFVYIGRMNLHHDLPATDWQNPYRIDKDTPENRATAITKYRSYINARIEAGSVDLNELVGKTLVCWCSPQPCHGDVLLELLRERGHSVDVPESKKQERQPEAAAQLALFDLPVPVQQRRHFD